MWSGGTITIPLGGTMILKQETLAIEIADPGLIPLDVAVFWQV
jgi:hypothetical protein